MADRGDGAAAGRDTWQSVERNRELAIIWPLLGRHIAFHRRLVDLTANVKAALILSQAIYWTRHGRDIAMNDGWLHRRDVQPPAGCFDISAICVSHALHDGR